MQIIKGRLQGFLLDRPLIVYSGDKMADKSETRVLNDFNYDGIVMNKNPSRKHK